MKPIISLPVPSNEEMARWLHEWDSLEEYTMQETALNRVFKEDAALRLNSDINAVLIKCAVLNDFYSTNIYKIYLLAQWILEIRDVDARLAAGDLSLVGEIANIGGKEFTLKSRSKPYVMPRVYSFATKFCSHHNECAFPIYDSYVHQILDYYNSRPDTHFTDVKTYMHPRRGEDKYPPIVKEYKNFVKAIADFRDHFGLSEEGFKNIDRYLWQLGKFAFPKRYGKKEDVE